MSEDWYVSRIFFSKMTSKMNSDAQPHMTHNSSTGPFVSLYSLFSKKKTEHYGELYVMFKVPQQTYIFLKKFESKCMAFGVQDMRAP